MRLRPTVRLAVLMIVAVVALSACGGDDEGTLSGDGANGIDLAFVDEMTRHHQAAIDMAKMAETKAEHREIKELAGRIVKTQQAEIEEMTELGQSFVDAGIKPRSLGMSMTEMGMESMASLEKADPFDKAFIEMMIVHHKGAVDMAEVELRGGGDEQTLRIADAIGSAQQGEIEDMEGWYQEWYGKPVPETMSHEMG